MKGAPLKDRFVSSALGICLFSIVLGGCGFLDSAMRPVQSTPTTLSGRIVDSLTSLGISSAVLTLQGASAASVASGENGQFQFNQATTGIKTLTIQADGYKLFSIKADLAKTPNVLDTLRLTRLNHAPHINRFVYPPNNALNINQQVRFQWSFSDDDFKVQTSRESLTYYFYFGDATPPPLIDSGRLNVNVLKMDSIYLPFSIAYMVFKPDSLFSVLAANRSYYWRVRLKDLFNDSVTGNIQTFRTGQDLSTRCITGTDTMVLVEPAGGTPFCMDKFEFSNIRYSDFWHERNQDSVFSYPGSIQYSMSKQTNTPVIEINYDTALLVCDSLGKRLCTISEWKAAYGGHEQRWYPYGNEYDSGRCHTEFSLDREREGFSPVIPVDSGSCISEFGIYDLSGNVSEWVENDINGEPYFPFNGEGEGLTYYAGGSWGSGTASNLNSIYGSTAKRRVDVGFRCCKTIK